MPSCNTEFLLLLSYALKVCDVSIIVVVLNSCIVGVMLKMKGILNMRDVLKLIRV